MTTIPQRPIADPPPWWQRAEHLRRLNAERQRADAVRRLRRIEAAARDRQAAEPRPPKELPTILDSDRLAAPFLERIGIRGRVQLLLWAGMTVVGACAVFSFFTAPLMELGTAMAVIAVTSMLILSYVM